MLFQKLGNLQEKLHSILYWVTELLPPQDCCSLKEIWPILTCFIIHLQLIFLNITGWRRDVLGSAQTRSRSALLKNPLCVLRIKDTIYYWLNYWRQPVLSYRRECPMGNVARQWWRKKIATHVNRLNNRAVSGDTWIGMMKISSSPTDQATVTRLRSW